MNIYENKYIVFINGYEYILWDNGILVYFIYVYKYIRYIYRERYIERAVYIGGDVREGNGRFGFSFWFSRFIL